MSLLVAVILGLVQAATEFLPVSSTAHLLVFGELFGQSLDDARFRAFVTIIQSGTTLAVIVYFRDDLWRLAAAWLRSLRSRNLLETPESRLAWYIALGTLPAALAGKLLERQIEALGNWVIAASLAA
jgi:undecaprenyl-diphosphatase